MKANTNQIKWMRGLGNASYIIGIAFLIAALLANALPAAPVFATGGPGGSDCAHENTDGDDEFCQSLDGQSGSWTAPAGYTLSSFVIKAGTQDYGAVPGCYEVTQSETSVSWSRVGDGSECKEISHVEIYYKSSPPPPCTWNPEIPANSEHCLECPWVPRIWIGNPACIPPCWYDPNIPASSPDCPEQCQWNPQIPADDPACFEPCLLDPSIPATSPLCIPCPYDPSIPASNPECEVCPFNPEIGINDPECPGPCEWNPQIPANDDACFEPCEWNSQIPADDAACFEPCQWNPQIPADDEACFEPCQWNPAIPVGDATCKPKVSFGSCYNPIKGLFELKVVNKGVVGYYIGYDVYQEAGLTNLGFFEAGQSKSFDVPFLNGNKDTLRKYASLTGEEPWTTAGGTHVFDPNTEYVCEYDPARVEVSCNPYVEQKLTWTIHNDNDYPVVYFWTWSSSLEPGGMGNIAALSSGSFTTEYNPATMQIRLGSLQFYIDPEDCNIPPKDETPTPPPPIIPKVKTVAPPVVTPQILIPVTGVAVGSSESQQMTLVNLGLAFLGLGLVLNGFARTRKDWDI